MKFIRDFFITAAGVAASIYALNIAISLAVG